MTSADVNDANRGTDILTNMEDNDDTRKTN